METVLEATARLRVGYPNDFTALPGGRLRCTACDRAIPASSATMVDMVRFEGDSNPDDQAILAALVTTCGHRGLFMSAYGPTTAVEAIEVLQALQA